MDGNPASIVPMPVTAEGYTDWAALAASLPTRPIEGPQLPEAEGWVRIPLAGAEQTLYWAEGTRYEGIMPQISLRHVGSADPEELLRAGDSPGSLPLGVEPWAAGSWRGIHGAWSLSRYGSTVIRRQWVLDGGPNGLVEVVAQHNAYLSGHLTPVLNGLVAGITPASAAGSDLAADLDWAVDAAERARPALADRGQTGLLRPRSLALAERDRIVADFSAGPGWSITAGQDGAAAVTGSAAVRRIGNLWTDGAQCLVEHTAAEPDGAGRVQLGRYARDDAADMLLRVVGHRPEGPSDVPVSLLPAAAFAARLHDRTVPLPPEIPEGAVVSSHLGPQEIYRWWTADWSWWTLHREAGTDHGREQTEGIRVLTVAGFGHYLWEGGESIRLQSVDGLTLFGMLFGLLDASAASRHR